MAVAVILSASSFQYYSSNADRIAKIAADDIRLNAKIEAHDLSGIVENKLAKVVAVLNTLTASKKIQSLDVEGGKDLINQSQQSTADITEGYFWLDKDGTTVWNSIFATNQTLQEEYGKLNLNFRTYFIEPKETGQPYYSSVVESLDGIPRIYFSMPILSDEDKSFEGVLVAAIKSTTLAEQVKQELFPGIESRVGLIDRNGVFMYNANTSWIGRTIYSEEVRTEIERSLSLDSTQISKIYNEILQGKSGSVDAVATSTQIMTTIAYQPVFLDNQQDHDDDHHLFTVIISIPHILAEDVVLLINEQRIYSTVIVTGIGIIAIGIAIVVLMWNKKLREVVSKRTAELREANEQLKIREDLQKEFINIAAHELRTPIQPILGLADIKELQLQDDDRKGGGEGKGEEIKITKDEMNIIIRNAKRLEKLSSDILEIARIESGNLRLNLQEFDLNNDVIMPLVKDLQSSMNGKDLKINLSIQGGKKMPVKGDVNRITQALWNLLDNALKFTDKGSISIIAKKENDYIVITVKDTGSGINSKILPRLFTRFATMSEKGTGIGLYISKKIVEAHGGKISGQNNEDGPGASFSISLPMYYNNNGGGDGGGKKEREEYLRFREKEEEQVRAKTWPDISSMKIFS